MSTWLEDIVISLEKLGGRASLSDIYREVKKKRGEELPDSWKEIICKTINIHSIDPKDSNGKGLFYSVGGKRSGIWELKKNIGRTLIAPDFKSTDLPERQKSELYRIIRDTALTRLLKELHDNKCQICGLTITLPGGYKYSEAHHIKPLGKDHNGPDVGENIIILCPNHHVECDYRSTPLDMNDIKKQPNHNISQKYVDYHNDLFGKMI